MNTNLEKNFLENIKTPNELYDFMKANIKYGFYSNYY